MFANLIKTHTRCITAFFYPTKITYSIPLYDDILMKHVKVEVKNRNLLITLSQPLTLSHPSDFSYDSSYTLKAISDENENSSQSHPPSLS